MYPYNNLWIFLYIYLYFFLVHVTTFLLYKFLKVKLLGQNSLHTLKNFRYILLNCPLQTLYHVFEFFSTLRFFPLVGFVLLLVVLCIGMI